MHKGFEIPNVYEDLRILSIRGSWKYNVAWRSKKIVVSLQFFNLNKVIVACFANLNLSRVGLVLVPQMYLCFVRLPFFPSASWPLSFLSLFLWPSLIHVRMPELGRAFVHGHNFVHSWSGLIILVVGRLHGATFLYNLTPVLFVSFKSLSS